MYHYSSHCFVVLWDICYTTEHSLQSQRDITFYKQSKQSKKFSSKMLKMCFQNILSLVTYVFSILPGLIVNRTLFRLDLHTPSKVKYIWWKGFVFKTSTLFLSTPVPIISIICFISNVPIWCGENENVTSWKGRHIMRHMRQKRVKFCVILYMIESLLSMLTSKTGVQNWACRMYQQAQKISNIRWHKSVTH